MHLNFERNQFGDPIGLPLGEVIRPTRPSASVALKGQYCHLVALDADKHALDLWNAFSLDSEGKLWTYMPQGPFTSAVEYRAWVEEFQGKEDPFFYAIVENVSGKAVGVASYLRIDPGASSIEVGWITFSPIIQQRPIATEAMYLMMRHAFELGYRRYEWKCNALNLPSINAAMRLGMSFEGLFRQATMVKGRNRDTAWFSILDKDWPVARQAFETWLSRDNFDPSGQQKSSLSTLTADLVSDRWPRLDVGTNR